MNVNKSLVNRKFPPISHPLQNNLKEQCFYLVFFFFCMHLYIFCIQLFRLNHYLPNLNNNRFLFIYIRDAVSILDQLIINIIHCFNHCLYFMYLYFCIIYNSTQVEIFKVHGACFLEFIVYLSKLRHIKFIFLF